MEKRTFYLTGQGRQSAADFCRIAPEGMKVTFAPPGRNLDQNAKFHAMCTDFAKQVEFAGKKRSMEEWKLILISGHAVATKTETEVVSGLEGEFLNLRESSAKMSKARMSNLIEYAHAIGAEKGVVFSDR